jgi:hypothetical protein
MAEKNSLWPRLTCSNRSDISTTDYRAEKQRKGKNPNSRAAKTKSNQHHSNGTITTNQQLFSLHLLLLRRPSYDTPYAQNECKNTALYMNRARWCKEGLAHSFIPLVHKEKRSNDADINIHSA